MTTELIPSEKFQIDAEDGALGMYQFGIKTAKHYFCKHCGIYPFHETARKKHHLRANIGCIDGVDSFALEVDVFDGKNLM